MQWQSPPKSRLSKKKRSKWTYALVGLVIILIIAIIGSLIASSNASSKLAADNTKINADRAIIAADSQKIADLNGQITDLSGQIAGLKKQAQDAQATANANAAQAYSSRLATLSQQESQLKSQQAAIAAETGQLQANQISQDGVYVVGHDIKSGTWHTSGGNQCYYATLNSTDTSNIADNNNFNGPETVDVSGAYAFQISGGCTWYLSS